MPTRKTASKDSTPASSKGSKTRAVKRPAGKDTPAARSTAKKAPRAGGAGAKGAAKRAVREDPGCVLTVDIGGSKVKILASGQSEPRTTRSGKDLSPAKMVAEVKRVAKGWKYDVVSLGYPGLVSASGPIAEPGNLGSGWVGFDYAAAFGCPVRIVNDAAMQALGSYDGGRMLFLGFGTGLGSVLIVNHTVVPLELGELMWGDKTFSAQFGRKGLERSGEKRWRERVLEVLPSLQRAFVADYVVIGGGNSKYLLEPLPPNIRLGHNLTAFRGGYRLWGIDEMPTWDASNLPEAIGRWRLL